MGKDIGLVVVKSGYRMKYFPSRNSKGKDHMKDPSTCSRSNSVKQNLFYILQTRNDKVDSPDFITSM